MKYPYEIFDCSGDAGLLRFMVCKSDLRLCITTVLGEGHEHGRHTVYMAAEDVEGLKDFLNTHYPTELGS